MSENVTQPPSSDGSLFSIPTYILAIAAVVCGLAIVIIIIVAIVAYRRYRYRESTAYAELGEDSDDETKPEASRLINKTGNGRTIQLDTIESGVEPSVHHNKSSERPLVLPRYQPGGKVDTITITAEELHNSPGPGQIIPLDDDNVD